MHVTSRKVKILKARHLMEQRKKCRYSVACPITGFCSNGRCQPAANSPRPNRTSGQETKLVAERPGPPVAVLVSFPGPRAPHGPLRYLRLVGALLDAFHGAGKGAGHSFGVGHRVDPPRLPFAGGTHHWLARLSERASLLERPTIPTEKVVDWHLLSPLPSAVVRPQIRGCDLTTTTAFAPIRPLQHIDHDFGSLS